MIDQKLCLIMETSSLRIFPNVTSYSTHWVTCDTSFDTRFLYGKSRVVKLVTQITSFTANSSCMTTFD